MTRQIETSVGIKVAGVITAGLIAIVSTVTVLIWIGGFGDEPLAKDSAAHSSPPAHTHNTPPITPDVSITEPSAASGISGRSPAGGETMDAVPKTKRRTRRAFMGDEPQNGGKTVDAVPETPATSVLSNISTSYQNTPSVTPDTSTTDSVSSTSVPQAGLEGIWRQYIDETATGDFSVKINNATERYEMSTIQQSSQGIKSRGITNVQYDGETWSFDSDWGYKTGKFVLKKTDNDTFEGMVDGSRNRWVRVGNEDDAKNQAAIKLRLQTELKKYAESLFTSISLDPADSDFYLFSDELRKNTNAARLTITGQGYSDLMRASKDKNWLEMINLIDRPWTPYTEFPTKETIKSVFEQLNNQRNWEIQLRLNTPKKLIQEGKKIVPVSFYNFTDFSKVFRFDEVSAGGDVYVDTMCFATIENKKWQEKDFGYSADWSYWKGKRCFLLFNTKQQDAFRSQFQTWNELLKKEIESRQIAIKDDKLKPEIAFKEMRILYDSTLTEALEWCKNDGKTIKPKVQTPTDTKVQTLTDTIKEKERRLKLVELDMQLKETPDPKKRELRGQRNQLREEIKSLKEML